MSILLSTVFVVAAIVVARQGGQAIDPISLRPRRLARDAGAYAARGHVSNGSGAHTLVVFSDFECPYCRRFAGTLDSFRVRHPGVSISERNFPLVDIHPHAMNAALAAECASAAGLYGIARSQMFSRPELVKTEAWGELAGRIGVTDTAAFVSCVRQSTYVARVDSDVQDGLDLQLTGTPAVLFDHWLLPGTPSLQTLDSALADSSPAQSVSRARSPR